MFFASPRVPDPSRTRAVNSVSPYGNSISSLRVSCVQYWRTVPSFLFTNAEMPGVGCVHASSDKSLTSKRQPKSFSASVMYCGSVVEELIAGTPPGVIVGVGGGWIGASSHTSVLPFPSGRSAWICKSGRPAGSGLKTITPGGDPLALDFASTTIEKPLPVYGGLL